MCDLKILQFGGVNKTKNSNESARALNGLYKARHCDGAGNRLTHSSGELTQYKH